MPTTVSPQQKHFDQKYITATEIAAVCDVSRVTVHNARQRGILPNPILVGPNMIFIWEREPLRPFIDQWRAQLAAKGVHA